MGRNRVGRAVGPLVCAVLLAAGLLAALLLPPAAAAIGTEEWNSLVDQVNALTKKCNAATAKFNELTGRFNQIDPAAANAADALPLLADMSALNDQTAEGYRAEVALLDGAAKLDLTQEQQTFFAQQREINVLQLQLCDVLHDLTAKQQVAYGQWNTLSQAEQDNVAQQVSDLGTKASALVGQLQEKQEATEAYFADKLSEEGSSWYYYWPGPIFVGLLVGVFIRWRRRNKKGSGSGAELLDRQDLMKGS